MQRYIDPLLSADSVNSSGYDVAPTAYTCAVTSRNNRRGIASGVLCGPDPRLYNNDLTQLELELSSGVPSEQLALQR
jgi:hypothetical protein